MFSAVMPVRASDIREENDPATLLRRGPCPLRLAPPADSSDEATPIPGKDASPQEITRRSWEPTRNTCPFNVIGHRAISLPSGMEDGRPIGLMLVGRHFAEETVYRVAEAFERSGDWTTF
jgi:Asp-tRNA(Asn)/Glu-tRNA(Gln) amidotransferase A subunit family amidase